MSANLQHYASHSSKCISVIPSGDTAKLPPKHTLTSKSRDQTFSRFMGQLAWVLVYILLLLYLATSYVYWAKIESAWPIFR